MSLLDYGAIAFKNGKLMTTEMFADMKEMVGWEDTADMIPAYSKEPLQISHNYFTFVGDKEYTLAFYKNIMAIVEVYKNKITGLTSYHKDVEMFSDAEYTWSKWYRYIGGPCTVKHKNGYLVCKWDYKGDKYKVYFGYGVDIDSYLKWHIVNYYRSLPYYCSCKLYQFKNWLKELRYKYK